MTCLTQTNWAWLEHHSSKLLFWALFMRSHLSMTLCFLSEDMTSWVSLILATTSLQALPKWQLRQRETTSALVLPLMGWLDGIAAQDLQTGTPTYQEPKKYGYIWTHQLDLPLEAAGSSIWRAAWQCELKTRMERSAVVILSKTTQVLVALLLTFRHLCSTTSGIIWHVSTEQLALTSLITNYTRATLSLFPLRPTPKQTTIGSHLDTQKTCQSTSTKPESGDQLALMAKFSNICTGK